MNVLINASGARIGGAITILNSYLSSIDPNVNMYYLLSPNRPENLKPNIRHIKISTRSIFTPIFAIFFSIIFYIFFRCEKLISFSNVNTIYPIKCKVTYFHQLLILTSKTNKYKLLYFAILLSGFRNNTIIVQTSYVKLLYCRQFGEEINVLVKWPSINMPIYANANVNANANEVTSYLVLPITDIDSCHKNFHTALKYEQDFQSLNLKVIVCADNTMNLESDVFVFCGNLNINDFHYLLMNSIGVVTFSTEETINLPIFESLLFDKFAFVLSAPYVTGLVSDFPYLDNLLVFESQEKFTLLYKNRVYIPFCKNSILEGDWDI